MTNCIDFTQSEHKQFSKRFENQYDIPDERYELWVQLYRSDADGKHKAVLEYTGIMLLNFVSCSTE